MSKRTEQAAPDKGAPADAVDKESGAGDLGPILTICELPGWEGNKAYWKRTGWTFLHIRSSQTLMTPMQLARLVLERLWEWELHDEQGEPIPFAAYRDPEAVGQAALDEALADYDEEAEGQPLSEAARERIYERARDQADQANVEAFDRVPGKLWIWLSGAFVEAYGISSSPFHESSSPSSTSRSTASGKRPTGK